MSEYGQMLDQLSNDSNKQKEQVINESKDEIVQSSDDLFTVDQFVANLSRSTAEKNRRYATRPIQNISGYDIASGCIREIYYRLTGVPLKSYEDLWLPVTMRGVIGSAVHDYIQENFNFTEVEKSMKVPSINFSGRYDCSIGNHTLVEIKTAPYLGDKGYKNVVKTQQARKADFHQVMTYKYVLENFLKEMQRQPRESLRTDPPSADNYDIKYLQFIYIAHDIISADLESIPENRSLIAAFKRQLKSGKNKFSFITCITYDLTRIPNLDEYIKPIKSKIGAINDHLSSNKTPTMSNPFINKDSCFFCKYKEKCQIDGE
jgi:hypothetical protein